MRKIVITLNILIMCILCGCKSGGVSYQHLPRWRGFNLMEKFQSEPDSLSIIAPIWSYRNEPFKESDFKMISEFGFDFVRLPMSYKCWTMPGDPLAFREDVLQEIDQAIEWGEKYNLHVCINMHRAPGYCICPPKEQYDIWNDQTALDICVAHWTMFARRYKGISNERLSFDLINEPVTTDEKYYKVVIDLVKAIRKEDPNRLIIADGNNCGTKPVEAFKALKIAQSGRGYAPGYFTHYKATWSSPELAIANTPPTWPQIESDGKLWDKTALEEFFAPWITMKNDGYGVHIGEWGVYNRTGHDQTLMFMEDVLSTLKANNIGWALWNFRGTFGILDSGREDVVYEDYEGHKLDRKMLELLQKY